jgi:hypothetical protein
MSNQLFDAVVVASGHYHAPRIPNITGLADIKRLWPSRVLHSKGYRRPDSYAGKVSPYCTLLQIVRLNYHRMYCLSEEEYRPPTSLANWDQWQKTSTRAQGTVLMT